MKSKFWLLLLITSCLITYFTIFPIIAVSASESPEDSSNKKKDFVMQDENLDENINVIKDNDPNSETSLPNFGFTSEQAEKLKETEEKFQFQTEVSRLMNLIINSLYKTREIFLRELISNASDAIDKIRFLALTDPNALSNNSNLNITIWSDPKNNILTITDTGIGMTKEQLKENLGTIAKSGTSEFLQTIEEKKSDDNMNLIGQFGVGFYSVFLVADKVIVTTKHNDDEQYIWESQAINDFTIAKDPRGNTLGRGTQIKLHLKEDSLSFLEEGVIREEKPKKKTKTVEVPGWELMNTQKPIWTRDPKNVSDPEYENFYKSFAKDDAAPLAWTHFKAEGEVDFKSIIYIPSKAPPNLYQKVQEFTRNIKFFVKRVFITDEFLDFVPKYLAFIKAIIDADDIPLNVSRETLQHHKALQLIKKRIIKKTLDMIMNLSKDEEKYQKFLKEFGVSLKIGAIEDNTNRKILAKLLRFPSSHKNWTTLDDYIGRMKKKQTKMYFVTGSSVSELESSPFIEGYIARGYEVLYMVEPVDEVLIQHMPGHGGKMFQNIAKGDSKLDSDLEETTKLKSKYIKLIDWMQTSLSDFVERVQISNRLTSSPCAVIAGDWGLTGHMERIMAAQAFKQENDVMKDFYANQKKVLEINPHHPLIIGLLEKVESGKNDDKLKELVNVLYETTLIHKIDKTDKSDESKPIRDEL
ncbi:2464_t:CDS:2 [Diversispora eburnea]|uniref:2464_t:CDS:1 n=1 Tax=Diversispora eburnea TaxID=1213867 RepID=A0A9N9C2Z9_9GLOM|nr:2464_t:CDS:2 [Diversispora eburnea]